MLRLTKMLHGTGNIVVLDYGFFALQELVDMKKKGVYEAALVKEGIYRPRYIDVEKSGITSQTRILGIWIHFAVILTMFLFISSL